MAISPRWQTRDTIGFSTTAVTLDYDDAVETVGLTIGLLASDGQTLAPGGGHVVLTLTDNSNPQNPKVVVQGLDCNQYRSGGQNDAQRHIVAGPGATGTYVNAQGKTVNVPTAPVPPSVVAQVQPQGTPTLIVDADIT